MEVGAESRIQLNRRSIAGGGGRQIKPMSKSEVSSSKNQLPEPNTSRGARVLVLLAAFVIVVAGVRELKPIAIPFIIAVFLSVLSAPLLAWLIRNRAPRIIAVLLTVLFNVSVAVLFLLLIGGSLSAFTESIPVYQERLEVQMRSASEWFRDRGVDDWLEQQGLDVATVEWLTSLGILGAPGFEDDSSEPASRRRSSFGLFSASTIWGVASTALRSVAALMTMAFLIFLMMVFILFEATGFRQKLELALGWQREDLVRLSMAQREIQRYLVIKTVISLLTGCLIGVWTWWMAVDFPILWGLLAFILNYIPSIGSIIAALPAVSIGLIEMGPGRAILIAAGYVVVNVVLGNFIEPHVMGRRFGLSTLVVFLSLLFWGWLWGPIGMLLSVPLTVTLKIALEHTEDFGWIARLIGASPMPVKTAS